MERVLPAVSSSSSLRRSATGCNWRCTYFLRANGLTRPQKPSLVSIASGALPVALFEEVAAGAAAGAEVVVWASAGSANSAAIRTATMRFFIRISSGEGRVRKPLRKASYGYDFITASTDLGRKFRPPPY